MAPFVDLDELICDGFNSELPRQVNEEKLRIESDLEVLGYLCGSTSKLVMGYLQRLKEQTYSKQN